MKLSKVLLFIILGVVFWFSAAISIRLLGASALNENNPYLILFFILSIPVTLLFFVITKVIAKVKYSELLRPVVIITITATFLDAFALTYYRKLYSQSFEVSHYGSALILWGVGLGLLFSYYFEKRKSF